MDAKVGKGIKRDRDGYRVYVRVVVGPGRTELRTKRFGIDTKKSEMLAWREAQRVEARKAGPRPEVGTLAADVERYLGQVRAMPTYEWRARDLGEWVALWGKVRRDKITTEMIRAQLQTWRVEGPVITFIPRTGERRVRRDPATGKPVGCSVSVCNHRRTALLHLWNTLDGEGAPNPVRNVKPFDPPTPLPRGRELAPLEQAIALLRSPKQRARAKVLLWTGARGNCELAAMTPDHLKLDEGMCFVPTGKGATTMRAVPLNADGVAAWREFVAVDAWGPYNKDSLLKSIKLAAKKIGIGAAVRTYDFRHSIATAYLNEGADLADVQKLLGHSTGRMTRRYAPYTPEKLRLVGARLGGGQRAITAGDAAKLPIEVAHDPQVIDTTAVKVR